MHDRARCCATWPVVATSMSSVLRLLTVQGGHNDNLSLLAAHLAFRRDLLPALFDSLGGGNGSEGKQPGSALALGSSAPHPTMAQVALLEVLCAEAHEMAQLEPAPCTAAGQPPCSTAPGAAAQFLVDLAQQLAANSKAAPLSAGQQQALQACLHLQRDLCARDDSGAGLSGGSSLVEELQAAGFLPSTLAMLKALEPVQNPQRAAGGAAAAAAAPSTAGPDASGSGIPIAQLAPQLAARAAAFPAAPPYPGFRSDLLSVVANAAHGRPTVQVCLVDVCWVIGRLSNALLFDESAGTGLMVPRLGRHQRCGNKDCVLGLHFAFSTHPAYSCVGGSARAWWGGAGPGAVPAGSPLAAGTRVGAVGRAQLVRRKPRGASKWREPRAWRCCVDAARMHWQCSPQVAASEHLEDKGIARLPLLRSLVARPTDVPLTQEAIRELQLCTTVDNEELQRLGVKLDLDEHTGKLRVTKRESNGTAAAVTPSAAGI